MENLTHYPLLLFLVSFVALWVVAAAGSWLRRRYPETDGEHNEHLGVILAATLTLLGLIIGFSFSMAINRYDQRKNFEEAEANAIGTQSLRADFLPSADAANVRKLLAEYTGLRIQFYLNKDDDQRKRIDERTTQLQAALWSAVRAFVGSTANAGGGAGACRHERRHQLARLYAGGIPEPDSHRRVASHGDHRAMFQRADGLSVAKRQGR